MHLLSIFRGSRSLRATAEIRLGRQRRVFSQTARPLQFPLSFDGPIAVLEKGFQAEGRIREFAANDLTGLKEFAPHALVATLHTALELADRKLRGLLPLASLELALVVLTRIDDTPLAAHHRDLLWQAFAIPVFEQLQDADGMVIARECEVHDGLHLDDNAALPDELKSEIVTEHCECGGETPRLKRRAFDRQMAAAVAA